jgi:small subunit ribosomal protein S7
MSRRRRAEQRREVLPDAKFGDTVLTRFMNALMYDGKKSAAEGIVYGALEVIERKAKADAVKLFHEALDNVKPAVEVRSRRVGGATYQVPVEVRPERRPGAGDPLGDRPRRASRGENTMMERLSAELLDAANNRGGAVKKREDTHRMAEANKRLCPLPLVTDLEGPSHGAHHSARSLSQHRHHGAHRCRQDDHDRAHPFYTGKILQDR